MRETLGIRLAAAISTLALMLCAVGCETVPTSTKRSAVGGAAIGALGGQLLGGDTEATLIGAGIGAVGGVLINEHTQKKQNEAYSAGYAAGAKQ
jgi:osmotically inducible lipoprotein OsmB